MRRHRLPMALLSLVPLALAPHALTWADTPKFKIFGAAAYVSPLSDQGVHFGQVRDSIKAADALGWNVGFEARFNTLLGLEIDYVNATHDIEFGGERIGQARMQPLSATLNFHLLPTRVVDFYVGPTASYFIWSNADIDPVGHVGADNEFAWGASAGVEVGFGGTFAILGGVRWLRVDLTATDVPQFTVDPLFSRVGVAWRF